MLGKLMGRRRGEDRSESKSRKEDKAIIHQTVPDEVFATRNDQVPPPDQSWLDTVPVAGDKSPEAKTPVPEPSPPKPVAADATPAARPVSATPPLSDAATPAAAPLVLSGQSANAVAEGRPRFPYGWLVVVEGPGTGEWFPLERGMTRIGGGADHTVHLDFGDSGLGQASHADLGYDSARHLFVVQPVPGTQLRVNGVIQSAQTAVRDGDVMTLGGTSLRLVALCSQNFHWGSDLDRAGQT